MVILRVCTTVQVGCLLTTYHVTGYVQYVDKNTALNMSLIKFKGTQVYMGVDYVNKVKDGEKGRKSVGLTSIKAYSGNNLIVLDAEHIPTSMGALPNGCATWPSWRFTGPDWPNNGEIDVVEYCNTQNIDLTSLHTSVGCSQVNEDKSLFTGTWSTGSDGKTPATNCTGTAPKQFSGQGCGIRGTAQPVGYDFNKQKGGVYVLEWIPAQFIRMFFFPRAKIPADLIANAPLPDTWGLPYARFSLDSKDCPTSHFMNNTMLFSNTFCGDKAGGSDFSKKCSSSVKCQDYVKLNPSYFKEAYWLINYVKVFLGVVM
jgi:hypothetical protein